MTVSRKRARLSRNSPPPSTAHHDDVTTVTTDVSAIPLALDLDWVLHPLPVADFYAQYWDKRPLHIDRRSARDRHCGLFALDQCDAILTRHHADLAYGTDINVMQCSADGVRIDQNPTGPVTAAGVRAQFDSGSTLQLIQPQRFAPRLFALVAALEARLGSLVGSNAYLTPADSQGLEVHFDDVDVLALQCEGVKEWKIYEPIEPLARIHSRGFAPEELNVAQTVVLNPGDLLYLPRGTPHRARTLSGHHSTHVTVSCHQKTAMRDLVEATVTRAVQQLWNTAPEMRVGLPWRIIHGEGVEAVRAQHAHLLQVIPALAEDSVGRCIEDQAEEFTLHRLPPLPAPHISRLIATGMHELFRKPRDQLYACGDRVVDERCVVRLTDPAATRLNLRTQEIINGEAEEPMAEVLHPLLNDATTHMSRAATAEPRARLQFPIEAAETLAYLFERARQWTPVTAFASEFRFVLEALRENCVLQCRRLQ